MDIYHWRKLKENDNDVFGVQEEGTEDTDSNELISDRTIISEPVHNTPRKLGTQVSALSGAISVDDKKLFSESRAQTPGSVYSNLQKETPHEWTTTESRTVDPVSSEINRTKRGSQQPESTYNSHGSSTVSVPRTQLPDQGQEEILQQPRIKTTSFKLE